MIYHEDIFYPSEKDALMKLVSPIEDDARHKAFILPHMALEYIAHLYRKAFASIPDGTRIIGLFPLHREWSFFCHSSRIIIRGLYSIRSLYL